MIGDDDDSAHDAAGSGASDADEDATGGTSTGAGDRDGDTWQESDAGRSAETERGSGSDPDVERGSGVGRATERDAEAERLREEVEDLREELSAFREDVDDRTVHREEIESDLREYVRARVRRGHARGWGPYLVLLYGTIMTLGAFFLLEGLVAIAAMIVVWLSTLGLYVLMVLTGIALEAASKLGGIPRLLGRLRG